MKSIAAFLVVVLFVACKSNAPFTPKTDTGVVAFWATKKTNPVMYMATWSSRRRLLPAKGDSSRNEFQIDTTYLVKIADTIPDGKGGKKLDSLKHPIPMWVSVPDSLTRYVFIVPTPKQ